MSTTLNNVPARFGSWSTSPVGTAATGADVRNLIVQGVFTPPKLAMPGGAVVTVSAGGGKSSSG